MEWDGVLYGLLMVSRCDGKGGLVYPWDATIFRFGCWWDVMVLESGVHGIGWYWELGVGGMVSLLSPSQ